MALLGWGQLQAFKARADQFVNTGIAHTAASIEIVKDKENTMEQAGFIGGSALFGYILGAFSRRARLLKSWCIPELWAEALDMYATRKR